MDGWLETNAVTQPRIAALNEVTPGLRYRLYTSALPESATQATATFPEDSRPVKPLAKQVPED